MVLAYELVTERGRHEDTGRKILVFVDGEAVACSESVGVESLEEIRVSVLRVFPFEDSGRKVGMECVGENFQLWGRAVQNLGVDLVETVKVGNVAYDPNLIAVEEDNLFCVVIGRAQIRLLRELVGVGYAGGEVGRQEDRERYVRREKAGRYAGGVLGSWDRDYQASVRGRWRVVGDGVNVNGVGWVSPSLDLLGYLLGVWWGEDAGKTSVAKRVREKVKQCGDSVGQTDWG